MKVLASGTERLLVKDRGRSSCAHGLVTLPNHPERQVRPLHQFTGEKIKAGKVTGLAPGHAVCVVWVLWEIDISSYWGS